MAVSDLHTLKDQLPIVFDDIELPPDWTDDWLTWPIDTPDTGAVGDIEAEIVGYPDKGLGYPNDGLNRVEDRSPEEWPVPDFDVTFPGAPVQPPGGGLNLPPETLAFYLPFHFFYPDWWGIYLLTGGVRHLAREVFVEAQGQLTRRQAFVVGRLFLYYHEVFHHKVECFATRLEATHRRPLYKTGFVHYFRDMRRQGEFPEEALANAHAYRSVKTRLKGDKFSFDSAAIQAALDSLEVYVAKCPAGYNEMMKYVDTDAFESKRNGFAEDNHRTALPSIVGKDSDLWDVASHLFRGIAQINSRVIYITHRNAPIARRQAWNQPFLSSR